MKKSTKIMYMLSKLRWELKFECPSCSTIDEVCDGLETITKMLENSVIVDKNEFGLDYDVDYKHSDQYSPLTKKAQLISKKIYVFREENNDRFLTDALLERIKEDLLEAIEERVDEDEQEN